MNVWMLWKGEYSDWSIDGVFSSLEKLEEAKAKFPWIDYNAPMEFELDELLKPEMRTVYKARIICDSGEIKGPWKTGPDLCDPMRCQIQAMEYTHYSSELWVTSPRSPDHAIKVAVEARQEWLRNGKSFLGKTEWSVVVDESESDAISSM